MGLERLQELLQHLFLGLLAGAHVRMLPCVVAFPHIFEINITILIKIQLLEHPLHQVLPEGPHVALDCAEQLVEGNEAVIVHVEDVEEATALLLAELEAEVAEPLPEFLYFERSISVVVQDLEYSLQADQASGASGCQLFPQFGHQFIVFVLDAGVAGARVSRGAELVLVAISVVDGVGASG